MELLQHGGIILIVIILVSLFALYQFLEHLLRLSKERTDSDPLMKQVNVSIKNRDLDAALEACNYYGGPVARVMGAALNRLPYGRAAVEAAFQEATLEEERYLLRGLRSLATVAQISPLLGLLGTVTGMIMAFQDISVQGTGNPAVLAAGIGQALITTAAGLIVAIPSLIGHNYLAGRADGILLDIEKRREELMGNVVQVVASRKETNVPQANVSQAAGQPMPPPPTPSATPSSTPSSTRPTGAAASQRAGSV